MPIKITWLKDGNPLPIEPSVQVQHHQFVSALLFGNLAAQHSGFYTCVAKNGAAQANFTSKLVVRGIKDFNKYNYSKKVRYKNTIIFFSCTKMDHRTC